MEIAERRIDLTSRIGARAVTAGVFVTISLETVLMFLAGGLGLWSMGILDAEAVRGLSMAFYVWAAVAWIVSVFAGAFVAATTSRSGLRRDGLLHGLATWAAACLTSGLLLCTWFMAALAVDIASVDAVRAMGGRAMLLGMFVADAAALAAALLGGVLGARSEVRLEARVAARPAPAARGGFAPTTPTPQPT